jgi:hypothetical protein
MRIQLAFTGKSLNLQLSTLCSTTIMIIMIRNANITTTELAHYRLEYPFDWLKKASVRETLNIMLMSIFPCDALTYCHRLVNIL